MFRSSVRRWYRQIMFHRQVANSLIVIDDIGDWNEVSGAIHLDRMTFQEVCIATAAGQPVADYRIGLAATAKHRIIGNAHTKGHDKESPDCRVDHVQVKVPVVSEAHTVVQPRCN